MGEVEEFDEFEGVESGGQICMESEVIMLARNMIKFVL